MFITSIDTIYDDHISMLESGIEIVLSSSDNSDSDNSQ
jgi:hypothetical protein